MCGSEPFKTYIITNYYADNRPIIHSLTYMYDLRHYNNVRTNKNVLRANRAIWESLINIALGQLCQYNYRWSVGGLGSLMITMEKSCRLVPKI